jgi:hypothetical protein
LKPAAGVMSQSSRNALYTIAEWWRPPRTVGPHRQYGSLTGVLDAGLFQTQAEMLRLYRRIATMDASAPLPSLADQAPIWASASSLARSWGLNRLADRLAEKERSGEWS